MTMRTYMVLPILLLAGCTTTTEPTLVKPVVVESVVAKQPDVPEVTPPSKPVLSKFVFQDPKLPSSVVALDADNYTAFRENLLIANKRELDWHSRLARANKSIRLLKGVPEPVAKQEVKPAPKPMVLPIPKAKPNAGSNTQNRPDNGTRTVLPTKTALELVPYGVY